MPSVRRARVSSQVFTGFLAGCHHAAMPLNGRTCLIEVSRSHSLFTVIIWGIAHSEGTAPNEASVGSKAALRLAP